MATDAPVLPTVSRTPLLRPGARAHVVALAVLVLLLFVNLGSTGSTGDFPAALQLDIRPAIDAAADWITDSIDRALRPFSELVKGVVAFADAAILAVPWPIIVLAVLLLGNLAGGWPIGLLMSGTLLFVGALGLWDMSLVTLNLMLFSVLASLAAGFPLGVLAARSDRFERILRPVLDAMQTMPTFVYLVPILLLFGIGTTSAVIATVIYAMPPAIRLTNLGIRQVPSAAVEAARSFGSTSWQSLVKVELPLARPSIMAGFNQTVMMALGMVVFVALIGASGLGKEIWFAMRQLKIGRAVEGGVAVVLIAIMLDRAIHALSRKRSGVRPKGSQVAVWAAGAALAISGLAAWILGESLPGWVRTFPADWRIPLGVPIDAAVHWMNRELGTITVPLRTYLFDFVLGPVKRTLLWLPWPCVVLGIGYLVWRVAEWRTALAAILGLLFIGITGVWNAAMITMSQVLAAMLLVALIGLPVGMLAGRSNFVDVLLRPVLDTMQALPAFVYFPVVIMLFKVGALSGIVATVIYAMPPLIRLTSLGIRQVPADIVEAARACGSTPMQILAKIELPMALPSIMLGMNQAILMALAMVVYAALIGAPGLGAEVLLAIGSFDTGSGFVSGTSIVILALIADRMTQAWARRSQASSASSVRRT